MKVAKQNIKTYAAMRAAQLICSHMIYMAKIICGHMIYMAKMICRIWIAKLYKVVDNKIFKKSQEI